MFNNVFLDPRSFQLGQVLSACESEQYNGPIWKAGGPTPGESTQSWCPIGRKRAGSCTPGPSESVREPSRASPNLEIIRGDHSGCPTCRANPPDHARPCLQSIAPCFWIIYRP